MRSDWVSGFTGFDFSGFGIIFTLCFGIILVGFIIIAVKGLGQWHNNNNSPRLNSYATAVIKRTNVTHFSSADNMNTTVDTTYYVTFQFPSGDRSEFSVNGHEYGQIAEGDYGVLYFQGTRFLSFDRSLNG